jgi:drug/metabolite transporter (DMT)-like permease
VGYAIWYAALHGLTTTRAATVQLSVPVIAALSGVILLSEHLSARLVIAGIFILGGIALALSGRVKRF